MALRMDYWAPLRYKILSLLVAAGWFRTAGRLQLCLNRWQAI
jgi:hypothetical protein